MSDNDTERGSTIGDSVETLTEDAVEDLAFRAPVLPGMKLSVVESAGRVYTALRAKREMAAALRKAEDGLKAKKEMEEAVRKASVAEDGHMPPAKKMRTDPDGTGKFGQKGADGTDNDIGKDGTDRKGKTGKHGKAEAYGIDKASDKTGKKEMWGISHEASRCNYLVRTGVASKSFNYKKDGDWEKAYEAAKAYMARS